MSPFKLTERCTYQKGLCNTENSILMWLPSHYNPCRLIKGQTTTCLVTGDRMACPKLQIAVTKITPATICGLQIG